MNIEIRGIDELYKKLGNAAATSTLEKPMHRSVLLIQRDMAKYPPKPSSSLYRRTGTLGRRWTTKVTRSNNGVVGKVGNNTSYGPWVQSDRFQAWMHRGRWQTDKQVLMNDLQKITGFFKQAVDAALRGE